MKIILFGAAGQVGSELKKLFLQQTNCELIAITRKECDLTQNSQIQSCLDKHSDAELVINAAAYTAVDKAEQESELAIQINHQAVKVIGEISAKYKIPTIHISTDYVFNGQGNRPYTELEPTEPLGVYGKSKLAGEQALLKTNPKSIILRVSWIFGVYGANFVKTILKHAQNKSELNIVDDQYGCPTAAKDIARVIATISQQIIKVDFDTWGIYHYSSKQPCSWYEFANGFMERAQQLTKCKLSKLNAISTEEYPTLSQRPTYSVLSCEKIYKTFGIEQQGWQEYVDEIIMSEFNILPYQNILVTGSAGFIGSHFVKELLSLNSEIKVISLDKLSYAGNIENLSSVLEHPRHHFVEGDICDEVLVNEILRKYDIKSIVHFAAESHVDNSIKNPQPFLQSNVEGTYKLLEAARQYWLLEKEYSKTECRFHHVSTDEVYGSLNSKDPAFTEETPYRPNSPYSASKACSDHWVRAYYHTYSLPVTISNCSNNFGPNQHQEKLIPTVIKACVNQQAIPVYGNGQNVRDWLYVGDHCKAIIKILQKGRLGETYNIGGDNELSNLTLIHKICDVMDQVNPDNLPHSELITFVKDRAGHDFRYAIDNRKICDEISWKPSLDFEKHLQATVEFYKSSISQADKADALAS